MWQRVLWTSQICGPVCHNFTRTKPLVLTKIQVIDIAFSLRTQVVEIQRLTTNDKSTALTNHPSSWGGSKAEPQFTSRWCRPRKESSAVRKGPAFQVMLAPLWPGSVKSALLYPSLYIGSIFSPWWCYYF